MSEPRGPSPAGILTTLGVIALGVLCCAGPALLAGGALASLGGLLRNPLLQNSVGPWCRAQSQCRSHVRRQTSTCLPVDHVFRPAVMLEA